MTLSFLQVITDMQTGRATLMPALISPNNSLNWRRSFSSTSTWANQEKQAISLAVHLRDTRLVPEQVHEAEEEREGRPGTSALSHCSRCHDKSAKN